MAQLIDTVDALQDPLDRSAEFTELSSMSLDILDGNK